MSYRRRLERDLDGWIAAGLVPAGSRAGILETVGEGRRLDAATALGVIGALLAGVAVIAFVAANWAEIPRIARFALILAAFAGAAGAAAWASSRERPIASQSLLAVAALIFAAAIGLTGQIFDIAGEPKAALRGAGLAAALLGLAGRSPWTLAIALVFFALGDVAAGGVLNMVQPQPGWTALAAPLGAALALRWRSAVLAMVAGPATVIGMASLFAALLPRGGGESIAWILTAIFLALAAAARTLRGRFETSASTLYGWWTWSALGAFALVGAGKTLNGAPHSIVLLLLSGAVVALGRTDRHTGVTTAGVLGLIGGGAMLLFSLGVGLMTSAAVFATCAVVALAVAFLMRRSRPA